MKSRKHLGLAFIAVATIGAGAVGFISTAARADDYNMKATLLDVNGVKVGRVKFSSDEHHTYVKVRLSGAPGADAFHGFHIHANNDPANGEGCAAAGKFVSADGHFKQAGQIHGQHTGDLPSVYVNADGSFEATYTLDKINREELTGKAVIMHAGADNFGNVPLGAEPDKYTSNSQAAIDLTNATGNAGARVACGLIG
jgi:superoxide dismutase, Cu-Zn family